MTVYVENDTPNLTDAICEAVRQQWPELFREKKPTARARLLPRGVYRERQTLVARFYRRVDGKQVVIFVARGDAGDLSTQTAERLGRACASAAATWDEVRKAS